MRTAWSPAALQVGAQRGADDQAAVVQRLLADAERPGQVALQVVAEERADDGVDAAVRRPGLGRDGDRLGRDLGELLLGDVAEREHPAQHLVAPLLGPLRVVDRVVGGRRLDQPGEDGGLRERQIGRVDAEVRPCRGLDPVRARAEVHEVEVAGEDLVLRVLLLEGQCQAGLAQLAADAVLGGGGPLLGRDRGLQQRLLDQLLGDRRAALEHRARPQVAQQGAQRALDVQAVVLVEPGVLDVDEGLLHDRGDPVGPDGHAVVPVEVRDHGAVGGQDGGVPGQRRVGALQRRQQGDRRAGGEPRTGEPRKHQAGHQRPGQRDGDERQRGHRPQFGMRTPCRPTCHRITSSPGADREERDRHRPVRRGNDAPGASPSISRGDSVPAAGRDTGRSRLPRRMRRVRGRLRRVNAVTGSDVFESEGPDRRAPDCPGGAETQPPGRRGSADRGDLVGGGAAHR